MSADIKVMVDYYKADNEIVTALQYCRTFSQQDSQVFEYISTFNSSNLLSSGSYGTAGSQLWRRILRIEDLIDN